MDFSETPTVPCEFCETSVSINQYNGHRETCKKNPYAKTYSETIPCEICSQEVTFSQYEEHLRSHSQPSYNQISQQPRPGPSTHAQRIGLSPNINNQNTMEYGQQPQRQSDRSRGGGISGLESLFNNLSQSMQPLLAPQNRATQPQAANYTQPARGIPMTTQTRDMGEGNTRRTQVILGNNGIITVTSNFSRSQDGSQVASQQQGYSQPMIATLPDLIRALMSGEEGHAGAFLQQLGIQQPERGFKKEELDQNFVTAKFDKSKSGNLAEEYRHCLICLSDFEDDEELRFLECCHRFHSQCIDSWMKSNTTCPVCKHDFKNFNAE